MTPEKIIEVVQALDPLADLPRTGWLLRGVRPCESVADHSWAASVVAMMLVDALRADGAEVDGERVLRMVLLHDAAEAGTGDLPLTNKTPAVSAAMHEMEARFVREALTVEQVRLWEEAELGETLEARIVKAADKVQLMIKVLTYERHGRGHLDEFWRNPRNFKDQGLAPASAVFEAIAKRAGHAVPRG